MSASTPAADRRVRVVTRDLFFRARVEEQLRALGWEPVRGAAPQAVIEVAGEGDVETIRQQVAQGGRAVAFGSHVRADLLTAARQAGAVAVPNSQLDATLRKVFGAASS